MSSTSKDAHKCQSFFNIVKSLGYPNISSYSASNFDFLFRLQGTEKFFDWFLDNVQENCLLSAQELKQFEEKVAKGQVIWDLKRLEAMASLINTAQASANNAVQQYASDDQYEDKIRKSFQASFSGADNADSVESLEKENDLLEKELELLTKSYELRKSQQGMLSENMGKLKALKSAEEKQKYQHERKSAEMSSQLKSLSQHLNQSIREFDINFGSDDSLVNKLTQSFKQSECKTEAYFENERRLLDEIAELARCKIDIAYLFNEKSDKENLKTSSIHESTDANRIDAEAKEIEVIAQKYVKLMERTMLSKMEFELANCMLNSLQQVNEKKSEFFIFTREQLEQPNGNSHRQYIEEKTVEFDKRAKLLDQESEALTQKIGQLIGSISKLKTVSLIEADITKRLIESSLFVERQDKMIKYLSAQRERIQFFNQIQSFKSVEYRELKEILEDLAQKKSLFMSSAGPNPAAKSELSQSLQLLKPSMSSTVFSPSTSMLAASSAHPAPTSATASSFSASMAGIFASSNLHLPLATQSVRPPLPLFGQPQQQASRQASDQEDSPYRHILNQFLIAALTRLQSASQLDDHKFKLKKPISIDFDDNFESFFHMFNSIHSYNHTNKLSDMRTGLKQLEAAIESTMDYLYDKDETKERAGSRINHNLSKINIKMPRHAQEPLQRLDAQTTELQELFYLKVFQVYTNLRMQVNSSQLEQLKRNLFVQFYNNPQQLEAITNHLNSL